MNDGKKMRSSAELPAYKRFEKSRSRWIYPSFQNTVFVFCGDWGSAPTSMKQAGPVWTESACFRKVGTALHCLPLSCPRSYPRISPLPILQSGQGVLASFQEIIAKIACVQRKDTAYFLRFIQLVSMLYDCRNIIALCTLKMNITQNMGRPHCAATLILILL